MTGMSEGSSRRRAVTDGVRRAGSLTGDDPAVEPADRLSSFRVEHGKPARALPAILTGMQVLVMTIASLGSEQLTEV
jgi:hypothetical protein